MTTEAQRTQREYYRENIITRRPVADAVISHPADISDMEKIATLRSR
jgi:hypothetical protein